MADYASLHSNAQVAFVTDHTPDLGGAAFGTLTTLLVRALVTFGSKQTPGYMVDRADYYQQRMLLLIESHGELFSHEQLVEVRRKWRLADSVRASLEDQPELKIHQVWLKKRQYKNMMKDSFAVTKHISDRLRTANVFSRVSTRNLEENANITRREGKDERRTRSMDTPLVVGDPPAGLADDYISMRVFSPQSREGMCIFEHSAIHGIFTLYIECLEALTSALSQDTSASTKGLEPVLEDGVPDTPEETSQAVPIGQHAAATPEA
ncbi:hypothetical protein OF83DRAFT_1145750 [Amylostereum chailletii]|nr:hypothetical protein OF83DRAFT_1145750 [Amylostereum chailletii]